MLIDEVREISKRFYAALTRVVNGDVTPMSDVWSRADDASAMHSIGGRQTGWTEIEGGWQTLARAAAEGQIDLVQQVIRVHGETAWESGVEQGRSRLAGREINFEQRVTNVYRREEDGWKIVHHHADVSPVLRAIVGET